MKVLFILLISFILLFGCGKKSDPQYQGSINNFTKII